MSMRTFFSRISGTLERAAPKDFVGVDALKSKHRDQLSKFRQLTAQGEYQHLQRHTLHPWSGSDWWLFPTDRDSKQYNGAYKLDKIALETLSKDKDFIKDYREGVKLVASSWGWDLENLTDQTDDHRKWVGYNVRLGKMLDSLKLFGQHDLHKNIVYFVKRHKIESSLDPWIQRLL